MFNFNEKSVYRSAFFCVVMCIAIIENMYTKVNVLVISILKIQVVMLKLESLATSYDTNFPKLGPIQKFLNLGP